MHFIIVLLLFFNSQSPLGSKRKSKTLMLATIQKVTEILIFIYLWIKRMLQRSTVILK